MASEAGRSRGTGVAYRNCKRGSSRDEKLGHIADCADSCCVTTLALSYAAAQKAAAPGQGSVQRTTGAEFPGEHESGRRFRIDPADLPAPKTGPIVTDRSLICQRRDAAGPARFRRDTVCDRLANPRRLLVPANGDVLVAEQSRGISPCCGTRAKVVPMDRSLLSRTLTALRPAWRDDHLLVADQDGIWRVPHVVGALPPCRRQPPQRADQVPADKRKPVPGALGAELLTQKTCLRITVGHQNRQLSITRKPLQLFSGVGSSG